MATVIFDGDDRPGLDPWDLQVSPDGVLPFLVTSDKRAVGLNAPDLFPLSRFVFVAATYDKGKGLQTLYVDGVRVAQNTRVGDLTPVVKLVSNEYAGIGIGTNNGFSRSEYNMGWNGALSDLRIYSRALPAKDVSELYEETVATRADSPRRNSR